MSKFFKHKKARTGDSIEGLWIVEQRNLNPLNAEIYEKYEGLQATPKHQREVNYAYGEWWFKLLIKTSNFLAFIRAHNKTVGWVFCPE